MVNFGNVEQFNLKKPYKWPNYKERIEFFFEANVITSDTMKRAVFLSVCGSELFDLAKLLCNPSKLREVILVNLFKKLDDHFAPSPPEIAKRILFERRNQLEDESAAEFVAKLLELAECCNFGENLESRLRDRIVGGIKDLGVQKRLLMESKLTLQQAIEMVTAGESSERHMDKIRNGNSKFEELASVHAINKAHKKKKDTYSKSQMHDKSEKPCFRCNGSHSAHRCRFKEATCNYCEKKGHIERACLSKKKSNRNKQFQNPIVEESSDEDESLCHIGDRWASVGVVKVKINGQEMLIDSGAAASVISQVTFEKLTQKKNIKLVTMSNKYRD